jgi:hypothetical protein
VTPTIVRRRLALNALAVFIALAFWTWRGGPMALFLCSPLLIVALILKEHLMPVQFAAAPGGASIEIWNFRCGEYCFLFVATAFVGSGEHLMSKARMADSD